MAIYRKDLQEFAPCDVPILCCPECYAQYSADYGDYFLMEDDEPFVCFQCDTELFIGQEVTTIQVLKE